MFPPVVDAILHVLLAKVQLPHNAKPVQMGHQCQVLLEHALIMILILNYRIGEQEFYQHLLAHGQILTQGPTILGQHQKQIVHQHNMSLVITDTQIRHE